MSSVVYYSSGQVSEDQAKAVMAACAVTDAPGEKLPAAHAFVQVVAVGATPAVNAAMVVLITALRAHGKRAA